MPTELRDNQHELLVSDESTSLVFGTEDTGFLVLGYPSLESVDGQVGDVGRVREDGVSFGEDFLGGKAYSFEIGVLRDRDLDPHAGVADALDQLEGLWTSEVFRDTADSYGVLRTRFASRVTRCYGRPRRYAESASSLAHKGYVPVLADFVVSDGRFYDDAEQETTCSLVVPPEGGMVAPFVFPLTTTADAFQNGTLTVTGSRTTWAVVEFVGPVLNPTVTIGDLVVGLACTIPAGMSVTVDSRPWARSVVRSDGANQAGKLSYETPPLRRLLLAPGDHEVVYQGTDLTGTSVCRVRWRNARSRP